MLFFRRQWGLPARLARKLPGVPGLMTPSGINREMPFIAQGDGGCLAQMKLGCI
jgi:hypothetical protein